MSEVFESENEITICVDFENNNSTIKIRWLSLNLSFKEALNDIFA